MESTKDQIKHQTATDSKPPVSGLLLEQEKCKHKYKCTLDTDWWSHYVCEKCGHSYILDFD